MDLTVNQWLVGFDSLTGSQIFKDTYSKHKIAQTLGVYKQNKVSCFILKVIVMTDKPLWSQLHEELKDMPLMDAL